MTNGDGWERVPQRKKGKFGRAPIPPGTVTFSISSQRKHLEIRIEPDLLERAGMAPGENVTLRLKRNDLGEVQRIAVCPVAKGERPFRLSPVAMTYKKYIAGGRNPIRCRLTIMDQVRDLLVRSLFKSGPSTTLRFTDDAVHAELGWITVDFTKRGMYRAKGSEDNGAAASQTTERGAGQN